jgi:uncharacterized protein (DUF169 family)
MSQLSLDLSIFNKFNFEGAPVGIKFMFHKPEGIERLDKNIAFCAMIKEAQQRQIPFYSDLENQACNPATYVLGYDLPKVVEGGYLGVALQAFKEAYAGRRIYEVIPRLEKDTVNYIIFSPLDKLSFNPDLLIIVTDDASQAEIILRALSYTTGKIFSSKTTNVLGCAWLYAYPYLTGELNYITAGLGFGMRVNKAFPLGRQIISIPYDWLLTIITNLQEMPWVPPSYADETGEFDKKIFSELGLTPPSSI